MYPPNAFKAAGSTSFVRFYSFTSGAGSFHAGGANFAFADGSVRFLKDTIDSWPINPASGAPVGIKVNLNGSDLYLTYGTAAPRVYQALSTRSGGEVISADSY